MTSSKQFQLKIALFETPLFLSYMNNRGKRNKHSRALVPHRSPHQTPLKPERF